MDDVWFGYVAGIEATITYLPVMLLMIITGLYMGLHPALPAQNLGIYALTGLVLGAVLGAFATRGAIAPPFMASTLAVTILAGLALALVPKMTDTLVYTLITGLTLVMSNAMTSGVFWWEILPFSHAGVATTLILGLSLICGLVRLSITRLGDGWVVIAWRAAASWIVAIAILMTAVMQVAS